MPTPFITSSLPLVLFLGNPSKNPVESMTEDSYKTLFVARLPYDLDEAKLRREFERFGPIRMVRRESLCKDERSKSISFGMFTDQND